MESLMNSYNVTLLFERIGMVLTLYVVTLVCRMARCRYISKRQKAKLFIFLSSLHCEGQLKSSLRCLFVS